jgi:hypothetical protein
LTRCGYSDIRSSVLLVSTDLMPKHTFCDLVFGYKLEVVPPEQLTHAKRDLSSIEESIHSPHGWAGIAVFFVSGQKNDASTYQV